MQSGHSYGFSRKNKDWKNLAVQSKGVRLGGTKKYRAKAVIAAFVGLVPSNVGKVQIYFKKFEEY